MDNGKPKYQILKDYLVKTIQDNMKPGEKICSENELADRFEISRHTVRQAIGELVTEGWLYRVQGSGTFVSGNPLEKLPQAKTIGVVTTYLNDYIFPAIIRGIDSVLSQYGFNIILGCTYNRHERERFCLENLKTQNIGGLIVEPTRSTLPNPNLDLYREFGANGVPVLFIHARYSELDYPCIAEDDVLAGYIATKHLIGLGHARIGGIFKIDDIQGHCRFSGFQEAHREAGLKYSDSDVLWFYTDEADEKFRTGGAAGLARLLAECSAIVCYNDQIALKVLDVARETGLSIPGDLSVVSFDDSQLAVASEIKLTTVAHPKERLGEEAARAIISMMERPGDRIDVRMKPELMVRGSTRVWKNKGEL